MLKKIIISLFVIGICLNSQTILAHHGNAYASKKAMMKQLYSVGFDHVYKIKYHNQMKILVLNEEGEMQSQRIATYGDIVDVPRVPELDYLAKDKLVVKAYKIGETMLCYQPTYLSLMTGKIGARISFKTCYMFPNKISKIVDALDQ